MKRPQLTNFLAISNSNGIRIKGSVALFNMDSNKNIVHSLIPRSPIQNISQIFAKHFNLIIHGKNSYHETILNIEVETDGIGNFTHHISLDKTQDILHLDIYENSYNAGIHFYLGKQVPLSLKKQNKIIISDFDRTLADTKYHSPRDIYRSLNNPLEYFPTIYSGVNLLKNKIEEEFSPIILSASPHFYEKAISDWLSKHNIHTAPIFLKDVRTIFTFFTGHLTPKDIKSQGFYKLNQLTEIIKLVDIPEELILVGDAFESDPIIYQTFKKIITRQEDPWACWNSIKQRKEFRFTHKQSAKLLENFRYLYEKVSKDNINPKVYIYIRILPDMKGIKELQKNKNIITFMT